MTAPPRSTPDEARDAARALAAKGGSRDGQVGSNTVFAGGRDGLAGRGWSRRLVAARGVACGVARRGALLAAIAA